MIPGLSAQKISSIADDVHSTCQRIGMDEFNYSDYDSEGDILSLHDLSVKASDVYLLAEFALETLRNKK